MAVSLETASLPGTSPHPNATEDVATENLITSVCEDDMLAAKLAIDNGANVNVADKERKTLLHISVFTRS